MNKAILTVLIILSAGCATTDETVWLKPKDLKPGVRAELIDPAALSVVGVTINGYSLNDIRLKLGQVPPFRMPHVRDNVCYVGNSGTAIIFWVGAVGYGFSAYDSDASLPKGAVCARSADVSSDLKNQLGLSLMQSMGEVESLLGKPTSRQGNLVQYQFWMKRRMTERQEKLVGRPYDVPPVLPPFYFSVISTIQITLQDGLVKEYSIATTETS